jgi:hypothetical protein
MAAKIFMKTGRTISKPALAILAGGVAFCLVVLWFGTHKKPEPAVSPAARNDVTSLPAANDLSMTSAASQNDLPAVIPVSLTNFLDDADRAAAKSDATMQLLPRGAQIFGGIGFWLQGAINLQGLGTQTEQGENYRTNAVVLLDETNVADGRTVVTQRGKNIACIYLLAGARYSSSTPGETFANIVWHYSDGSTRRSQLQDAVHLRDWWRKPYEQPEQLPNALTKVAWRSARVAGSGISYRLYRLALVNPGPGKTIRSLEFVSPMTRPSLFVAALTLDPLMPGSRPDDLNSDEMTDPELKGQLQLFVQDDLGHPLANAQITSRFKSADAGSADQKYTTDNNGLALVPYPDTGLETLDVSADHEDYSGRKMLWDLKTGDVVPAGYTLKLGSSVNIGGIIMDEMQNPVAGANISLYRFWTGEDDNPDKKGDHPDFASQTVTTDAQGQWHATGLPAELLDHIGFDVKHPDFIGTNLTVGASDATENQLRAGTMKIILRRGLDVQGLVTDENDHQISGATVWAGQKYFRDRQQTKSDEQGQFVFHNISAGDVIFSVEAKGRQPDSKTFTVKPGMPDIVFKLLPGHIIRGIVQDGSNSPVSGVRVILEGDGDIGRTYEFSATTGADGRFEWDGAPADPMPFYFGKEGYEDKRNYKLSPDQDNMVTLHPPRQLQGLVLDADTGMAVTNFSIRTGHRQDENSDNLYGVIRNQEFNTPDGTFKMDMNEEDDNAVAVSSDDYAYQVQTLPDAQNGIVQATIRLQPGAALRGMVTSPDGTPMPGVTVAAISAQPNGAGLTLRHGRLASWNPQSRVVTTGADGRFTVSSPPEGGTVVAAGDFGFANVPLDQVRGSGVVVLQPWGRIEGTLKIGGQPAAGKDLMMNMNIPNIGTDWDSFKATTDDQGAFSFDQVPPGDISIVRLIQTSPNSWQHSYGKNVHVDPGQTVQVTIGDDGATINGVARYEMTPADGGSLNIQGNLSSQTPQPPSFNSPAEAQAFFKSPEWQALAQQQKNYGFILNGDGSFSVDDVAPGTYSLNITVRPGGSNPWMHPPIAQGQTTVTVPDDASPASPIFIGEVLLKNLPQAPAQ